MSLRIIGDVHGDMDRYLEIAEQAEYSLQVGDLSFDYSALDELDSTKHQFFGGNHDNYDTINYWPHSIGDYGLHELGGIRFFFVRGSISIDCLPRVADFILSNKKTWWYEEELTRDQLDAAIDAYEEARPDVVITHDCPSSLKARFSNPNVMKRFGWPENHSCLTQQALSVMQGIHQPKLWFFGHWHRNWNEVVNGTHFFCVNILDYLELDGKLNVSKGRRNKTAKH